MKYLIVKCEELGDQYECDANRVPMFITDNWEANVPDYPFEVYEINEDGTIDKRIKDYDEPMGQGMAFGYYDYDDEEEIFHLIEKFPNKTRDDSIPEYVVNELTKYEDCDDFAWLKNCGVISATAEDEDDRRIYAYCEYFDNRYAKPW